MAASKSSQPALEPARKSVRRPTPKSSSKPARKPNGSPVSKAPAAGDAARPQVTTIRLDEAVQSALRVLQAHSRVKRPLNKWVNLALADFIEKHAATLEIELEQALNNVRTYRKSDPGYKRSVKALIDAEVSFAAQDPMQGTREPRAQGPAVSMVRQLLHG